MGQGRDPLPRLFYLGSQPERNNDLSGSGTRHGQTNITKMPLSRFRAPENKSAMNNINVFLFPRNLIDNQHVTRYQSSLVTSNLTSISLKHPDQIILNRLKGSLLKWKNRLQNDGRTSKHLKVELSCVTYVFIVALFPCEQDCSIARDRIFSQAPTSNLVFETQQQWPTPSTELKVESVE